MPAIPFDPQAAPHKPQTDPQDPRDRPLTAQDLPQAVADMLVHCDLIYSRRARPKEEITAQALIFAADIASLAIGLTWNQLAQAFSEHRAQSPFYPKPSDINSILPYIQAKARAAPPPPPPPESPKSPDMPQKVYKAIKSGQWGKILIF